MMPLTERLLWTTCSKHFIDLILNPSATLQPPLAFIAEMEAEGSYVASRTLEVQGSDYLTSEPLFSLHNTIGLSLEKHLPL